MRPRYNLKNYGPESGPSMSDKEMSECRALIERYKASGAIKVKPPLSEKQVDSEVFNKPVHRPKS